MTPAAGGATLPAMPEPRRNDTGHRIGEYHHRAILTDADVREIRDLHEFRRLTAKTIHGLLAERDPPVRVSYHTVRAVIAYRRRVHP